MEVPPLHHPDFFKVPCSKYPISLKDLKVPSAEEATTAFTVVSVTDLDYVETYQLQEMLRKLQVVQSQGNRHGYRYA